MPKQLTKISDLKFDDKNFNKHNEFGSSLLEKSLRKFGAGRSILIDKNNNIIAGNGITETAGAIGLDDVQIIESDGKRIIAVKRTDIDLNTKAGRELALADNATAKSNIEFDTVLIEEVLSEEVMEEWGISTEREISIDKDKFSATAESYLNSAIRQIVLYFDIETHLKVLNKLEKIGIENDIEEDNSAVVLKLIKFYEANSSSKKRN